MSTDNTVPASLFSQEWATKSSGLLKALSANPSAASKYCVDLRTMDRRQPNRLRSHQTRRNDSCRLAFRVAARRGQVEEETRAATLGAFRSKRAGVRFDNRTSDCQAHAHSFRFCGKEMIENFLPPVRGQTGTEIAYTDFRTLSFKRTRTNNDAALGGRKSVHPDEWLDDEVEQYLLNLDRGSFHIRQARI